MIQGPEGEGLGWDDHCSRWEILHQSKSTIAASKFNGIYFVAKVMQVRGHRWDRLAEMIFLDSWNLVAFPNFGDDVTATKSACFCQPVHQSMRLRLTVRTHLFHSFFVFPCLCIVTHVPELVPRKSYPPSQERAGRVQKLEFEAMHGWYNYGCQSEGFAAVSGSGRHVAEEIMRI